MGDFDTCLTQQTSNVAFGKGVISFQPNHSVPVWTALVHDVCTVQQITPSRCEVPQQAFFFVFVYFPFGALRMLCTTRLAIWSSKLSYTKPARLICSPPVRTVKNKTQFFFIRELVSILGLRRCQVEGDVPDFKKMYLHKHQQCMICTWTHILKKHVNK